MPVKGWKFKDNNYYESNKISFLLLFSLAIIVSGCKKETTKTMDPIPDSIIAATTIPANPDYLVSSQ
jgi:hypothetical protein